MTAREMTEWAVFVEREPIGELRADARNAMLCSLLANIHRGKGKKSKPDEWMLKFAEPKRVMSSDEMLAQVVLINRQLGGKDLRNAS